MLDGTAGMLSLLIEEIHNMRVKLTKKEVTQALETFKVNVEKRENVIVDFSNVDLNELKEGMEDEIRCGARSNELIGILEDWSNSIGLDEFNIYIIEKD
jgi:hypothetical protein